MNILVNSPDKKKHFLDGLNRCFDQWGDGKQFTWYFESSRFFPRADLMTVIQGSEMAAGSAITYRELRLSDGRMIPVGVMTGSWTLPGARGNGLFGQMVERSCLQAKAQGANLLLAYTLRTSPSAGQLTRRCDFQVPTYYISGKSREGLAEVRGKTKPIGLDKIDFPIWSQQLKRPPPGVNYYCYEKPGAWFENFLNRPSPCEAFVDDLGSLGILERGTGGVSLQFFQSHSGAVFSSLRNFVDGTLGDNCPFFMFSTDGSLAAECSQRGWLVRQGFLAAFILGRGKIADYNVGMWIIHGGDRT